MCSAFGMQAQSNKDLEEEAYYYFNNKDFRKAYELYDKLYTKNPKDLDYKFKLGYCCLFYPEKKDRAIQIFEDIKANNSKKSKDIDYYVGKAYHVNYRFGDAIKSFEAYLAMIGNKVSDDDKLFVEDAKQTIKYCNSGIELIDKKVQADITNVGSPINSDEVEGVPVITADESIMIFTYAGKKSMGGKLNEELKPDEANGEYREDIFMSTKKSDSTWSDPVGIPSINTNGNDAAIAISPDGQTMFTFSSNNDLGDLYQSNLIGNEWTKPEKLNKNVNTEFWEGSCSMTADGRYLYFASERKGGLGGRDIWVSEKVNGDWGPASNLGSTINTSFDEDAPFIHPDGITLFLSSKGHTSIGGYDIMFSLKKDGEWLPPKNMGIPLNTTEDDRYYVINAKGDKGFFSSDRGGAGGKGKQDIYVVTPGILGEKPNISMLKGIVYGNDVPMEGKIEVFKVATSTLIGPYYSNKVSGKYLLALSPGYVYKVKCSAVGYDAIEEELDIENLDKFLEIKKDFYLYTPDFKPTNTNIPLTAMTSTAGVPPSTTTATSGTVATTTETTATVTETTTTVVSNDPCDPGAAKPDFTALKGKSLNNPEVYAKLLAIGGNICAGNMIFKVQIAAYRHPENYKYDHLIEYGKPEIVDYPDGITRFTQMEFRTLKEAEVQRQKAIAKGQADAWVVGFIDGKRYTLEELIMLDFLGKSIN